MLLFGRRSPRSLRCFCASERCQRNNAVQDRNAAQNRCILPAPEKPFLCPVLLRSSRGRDNSHRQSQIISDEYSPQCPEDVQNAQDIGHQYGIRVQVSQACSEAYAVVQHNSFIDENGCGKKRNQIQDSTVLLQDPGQSKQKESREKIPFMHLDAEHIKQDKQQRSEVRQETDFCLANRQGEHNDKCVRHCADTGPGPAFYKTGAENKPYGKRSCKERFCKECFPFPVPQRPNRSVDRAHSRKENRCRSICFICDGAPVSAGNIV